MSTATVVRIDAAPAALVRYAPRPHATLRLFCFPWSGAGASVFGAWAAAMPDEIELIGIQLPGRGARRDEPASARLAPLAGQLTRAVAAELDRAPGPFAFFGHSLGALLAHEVAGRLSATGHTPQLVVLSGSRAPHRAPRVALHGLRDGDLLAALERFGAMSDRVRDPGFRSYFLPLVRTDLTAAETHRPALAAPLPCPVSTWAGTDDWYAPCDEVARWRSLAGPAYRGRVFPGGHFYTGDLTRTATALLDDLAWSRRQAAAYRVRPLVAADRDAVLAMVDRCSDTSLYERFQAHGSAPARSHVASLLRDPDCYTAVVEHVVAGRPPQIAGLGSLFFDATTTAELALLVADAHQGRGVGTALAEHLHGHAVRHGTDRIEATTRAGNTRVVRLFRRLDDGVRVSRPDAGVIMLTVRLDRRGLDRRAA